MSCTGFNIALSEEIHARLPRSSAAGKRILIETAINRALDAAGWPTGPRGTVNVPATYWHVIVKDGKTGRILGHVGPIDDLERARRCAASWRTTGRLAWADRKPLGPALTNNF